MRAVVGERFAGLGVTVVLAVSVLAVFPSPVRSHMPVAVLILAGIGLAAVAARAYVHGGRSTR